MRRMESEELEGILSKRRGEERLDLSDLEFGDMDFRGKDLHNIDFRVCMFLNVIFDGADLSGSSIENARLDGCSLRGVNFRGAYMKGACMRGCDMTSCDISGADLFAAVLTDIISDEDTKWFRMHCPETGPILGYKKCVNDRLVQLLIPADAKRTSATMPSCRCNKAKVLTIKSFDDTEEFDEAWSLVDENFVYRKGQWVEVKNFNEDRWFDSTTGIHFWLTKADAIGY